MWQITLYYTTHERLTYRVTDADLLKFMRHLTNIRGLLNKTSWRKLTETDHD